MFARLAVFHGGWPFDAAEAVAGDELLDALSALVDHALVVRQRSRFWMLETVRAYASEQLEQSGEAPEVRRRHALWCLSLAQDAEQGLESPEQAEWFARLDREQENLRAAAEWAVANGEPEITLGIDGAVWRFWLARGAATRARDALRTALASGRGDTALRTKALLAAGVVAGATSDFTAANEAFEEALGLATSEGNRRDMARAFANLGLIALFSEDYDTAIDRITQADEIWRELGSLRGQSLQKQNLAIVHELRGDFERAVPLLEESLDLARADNNGTQVAISALTLGRFLLYRQSSDHRIPALLREGLERSVELSDRPLTAEGLEVVAHWALSKSQPAAAAQLIGAAEAERERAGATRKPDEGRYFEITVRELEQALGRDGYERERARGGRESLESAIELALRQTEDAQQVA